MVKKKRIALTIIALVVFLLIQKGKGFFIMSKYEWLPSESASENYPMEIIKGDFILSDNSSIYIPDGKTIHNGWGEALSIHIVGERFKPLPVKLFIHWFSYTEDKFFKGTFDLPYEKINNLFKIGIKDPLTNEDISYNRIIVGLAPEGELSLWLSSRVNVLEVANFKAEEVKTNWKTFLDNEKISRADYINLVLEEVLSKEQIEKLKKNGIPKGQWDSYRKQYPWEPEIIVSTPLIMWSKSYNGEYEFFNFSKIENKRTHRSIPKRIRINWINLYKNKYTADITFNEGEILQAFKKMSTDAPAHEMKLRFVINEKSQIIDIFLRDSLLILQLEKIQIKIYKL